MTAGAISREIRALVVEDDPSWQAILTEVLTDNGLSVDVTGSMDSAVELLREAPHRLAVLDLSLGGRDHSNQDGLRVLEAMRRQDPGCLAVFLTGYATVELAVNLMQDPRVFTCLRKETFRRAEFRDVIRQVLALAPLPAGPEARSASEGPTAAPVDPVPDEPKAQESRLGQALVVEDDAGWRSLFIELLSEAGYKVQSSSSYVEALGRLKRERFRLAVLDLSLANSQAPDANLDGYRLLAFTHQNQVPTIVVSGYAEPERIEQAYAEHHIFACLEKQGFDRQAFLQTVLQASTGPSLDPDIESLTPRERRVLELLARGLTNKEIGQQLFVTTNTVKRHLKSIFAKLGVHSRAAASARAISGGLVVDS